MSNDNVLHECPTLAAVDDLRHVDAVGWLLVVRGGKSKVWLWISKSY